MTQNLPASYTMSDLEKMAASIVKSSLFGIKSIDQAVTLMLVAQAEGLHPATAARDYHVIQGRPALKADAMMARFQAGGGVVEWVEYSDTKVSATFRHPQSPKPVLIEWTLEMARKIGLASKDNWKNYPRQMLKARVISEGIRATNPGIAVGVYTPEEVQDFAEKDITPTAGALGSLTAERQETVNATAVEIRALMANDQAFDAYSLIVGSDFDADEQTALWSLLDSKQRAALKRMQDAERANAAGKISPAQHKRLEARIKEIGVDRYQIKAYCLTEFGVQHFTDLTQEMYQSLDDKLGSTPKTAPPKPEDVSTGTDGGRVASDGAAPGADEALLIKAREFAECGLEKYRDWYLNVLTSAQRKTIGEERHKKLKELAAGVQAR